MLNLLPPQQKKEVEKEYKARRAVIFLCFMLGVLVVAFVSMIPLYLLSKQNWDDNNDKLSKFVDSSIMKQSRDLSSQTQMINSKISSLTFNKNVYIYDIIKKILDSRTSGISITNFSYSKKIGDKVDINISGIALSRETLISFEKNLEKDPSFVNINFPISNLAKDTNINFTFQTAMKI